MKFAYGMGLLVLGWMPLAFGQIQTSVSLVLDSGPGDNQLSVDIGNFLFSGGDQTTVSGTITADLILPTAGGQVDGLIFTGGNLSATDLSFTLDSFLGSVGSVTTSGLGGELFTVAQPWSTVMDGSFAGADHGLRFDQGSFSASISGENFAEDFGDNPSNFVGSGQGTLTLTELSRTDLLVRYRADLSFPVNGSEVVDEATGTSLTFAGDLSASGEFDFPLASAFAIWAAEQGRAGAGFAEAFGPGLLPNGLVWALRRTRADWRVTPAGTLELDLPAEGTRAELLIEQSNDLGAWNPASSSAVAGGLVTLPAASTGKIEIVAPTVDTFYRVRAVQP